MKTSSSGPAELELRVSAQTAWTVSDPGALDAAMLERPIVAAHRLL